MIALVDRNRPHLLPETVVTLHTFRFICGKKGLLLKNCEGMYAPRHESWHMPAREGRRWGEAVVWWGYVSARRQLEKESPTVICYQMIYSAHSRAANWPASPLCTSFDKVDSSACVTPPKRTKYRFWVHAMTCGDVEKREKDRETQRWGEEERERGMGAGSHNLV
jgi:hypothetical protein